MKFDSRRAAKLVRFRIQPTFVSCYQKLYHLSFAIRKFDNPIFEGCQNQTPGPKKLMFKQPLQFEII